ncbi:MAG: hypothetical protein H0W61_14355 [Bacteroidetes bacterium]|nr:hypothetical protein [Bacteroidota bacterium]
MKRLLSLSLLLPFLFCSLSCKKTKEKVDELTEFDISYSNNISVPSQTMSMNVPVDFTTPDVPTQSVSKFSEHKTTEDLVSEIKFTKMRVSVSSGNLDFLKSLSVYVKASGVGEQLIATKNPIPTGLTTLDLDLQDVNIKNFIIQPNIQFRVTVTIDASTLAGQTLNLAETAHVKATLIK